MRRLLLLVLTLLSLAVPASASAVNTVLVPDFSSDAADATNVDLFLVFKIQTALHSTDTISLDASGSEFSAQATDCVVIVDRTGRRFPVQSVSFPRGDHRLIVLSGAFDAPAGAQLIVQCSRMRHVGAVGNHTIAIETSADAVGGTREYTLEAPHELNQADVGLSTRSVGATNLDAKLEFNVPDGGGLSPESEIKITAPVGAHTIGSLVITDATTGNSVVKSPTISGADSEVTTVPAGMAIPPNHHVSISAFVFDQAVGAGTHQWRIDTDSSNETPTDVSYLASRPLHHLSVAGDASSLRVTARLSLIGGLTDAGSMVIESTTAAAPFGAGTSATLFNATKGISVSVFGSPSADHKKLTIFSLAPIDAGDIVVARVTGLAAAATGVRVTTTSDTVAFDQTVRALTSPSIDDQFAFMSPFGLGTQHGTDALTYRLKNNVASATVTFPSGFDIPNGGCQATVINVDTNQTASCVPLTPANPTNSAVVPLTGVTHNPGNRLAIKFFEMSIGAGAGTGPITVTDGAFTHTIRSGVLPAAPLRERRVSGSTLGANAADRLGFAAITRQAGEMLPQTEWTVGWPDGTLSSSSSAVRVIDVDAGSSQIPSGYTLSPDGHTATFHGITLPALHHFVLRFDAVTNPASAGPTTITVDTSSTEASPVTFNITAAKAVRDLGVAALDSSAAGATTDVRVHFTATPQGGLNGPFSTITIRSDSSLPSAAGSYQVTDLEGNRTTTPAVTLSDGGTDAVLTVTSPSFFSLGGEHLGVTIDGTTNPATPGTHQWTVSDSSDTVPATVDVPVL